MNKYKLHLKVQKLLRDIEKNEKDENIIQSIKIVANEIKDPFSSPIDEFLMDRENKDHPQEDSIDELKDEAIDYAEPNIKDEHPQEDSIDELKDEAIDYESPKEQEHPQEEVMDKVVDEVVENKKDENGDDDENDEKNQQDIVDKKDENLEELRSKQDEIQREIEELKDRQVESSLKRLSQDIAKRGQPKLAAIYLKASILSIVEILNDLLMKEFLIRDILENYSYLFSSDTVKEAKQFKPKESILYLQKQIIALNGKPVTQRLVIPTITPLSVEGVLLSVKEHTDKLIEDYRKAIKHVENDEKYLTLKIMLEKIVQHKPMIAQIKGV